MAWTPDPEPRDRGHPSTQAPPVPLPRGHAGAPGQAQRRCVPCTHTQARTQIQTHPPAGPLQLPSELQPAISTNYHACWGKDLINSPLRLQRGARAQGRLPEAGPLSPPSGRLPGVGEVAPVEDGGGHLSPSLAIYRHQSHAFRRMCACAQTYLAVSPQLKTDDRYIEQNGSHRKEETEGVRTRVL